MADLHQQLLAELDKPYEIWAPPNVAPALGAQRRALRAVVELHAPVNAGALSVILICEGCDPGDDATSSPDWPCSTIQAIARELGVQEDNHG